VQTYGKRVKMHSKRVKMHSKRVEQRKLRYLLCDLLASKSRMFRKYQANFSIYSNSKNSPFCM